LRIALFGGTFNPIHEGHLAIARAARDAFRLDWVLFVPANRPPHKGNEELAPYGARLRMVELASASEPQFAFSDLDSGEQPSYTINTIERQKERTPGADLYFLIGADAFREIATWYRWREVIRMVEFIVVSRPGHHYEVPEGAKVHRLDTVALPVSSSEIRATLARGEKPQGLPDKVYDFIRQRGLYVPAVS
jgi:nicotinate-nucleotide adenylyltransferase